jgi:hypothetical protein
VNVWGSWPVEWSCSARGRGSGAAEDPNGVRGEGIPAGAVVDVLGPGLDFRLRPSAAVHSWDLATAIATDSAIDDELAIIIYNWCAPALDQ